MATFDPNRIGPGTFELVRDSTTGNYTIKEVGFTKISPLNLPDLDTTAATTTATQTQTATDVTGDTVSQQTKMAFNMPDRGGDNQPDTTGNMLQEAKKTSSMLDDTFADTRQRMTTDDAYRGVTSPLDIKDPTSTVFGRPNMRDVAGDVQQDKPALELDEPTVRTNIKGLSARGTIDRRQGTTQETTDDSRFLPSNIATGIDVATQPQTALDMDRFVGVSRMGALAGDEKKDVKPVKKNALETVSTSLRTTGDSILSNLKTPMMMVLDAIVGAETATQTHDKGYFNNTRNGRIVTFDPVTGKEQNASTSLYAGMNRVSAFGNLEKAGAKRIATREATIARKGIKSATNPNGVSQDFVNNTNNMKDQQDNYRSSKNDSNIASYNRDKAKTQGSITQLNPNEMRNVAETGDAGGNPKSIVCTAMYQTTGLQDWAKAMKIWYIYQKRYLTIQHQEGYHKLFKPFVKGMHKNKIIKAIGAHVAKHRTQHLKHIMFNSKPSLLGKVYNKILEPICYWVGKV